MAATGIYGWYCLMNFAGEERTDKDNSSRTVELLQQALLNIKQVELDKINLQITKSPAYIDSCKKVEMKMQDIFLNLYSITNNNQIKIKDYYKLNLLIKQRLTTTENEMSSLLASGFRTRENNSSYEIDKEAEDEIITSIAKTKNETIQSSVKRRADLDKKYIEYLEGYGSGIGACLAMLLIVNILNKRNLRRRRRAEFELYENQRKFMVIAKNFPDGTINVLDRNLCYDFTEGKELIKYGISSEKLIGKSYLERFPEEMKIQVKEKLYNVFNRKSINEIFEFRYQGRHYLSNCVALWNKENEIDQILVVEQNITSDKRAEEKIRISLEKEKYLNKLTSLVVSVASHEFRTPLGTVVSSTELVSSYLKSAATIDVIREKCDKHLKRILSSVDNLVNMLNDIISIEKIEQGKIEVKAFPFNIVQFTEDLIEEMQTILKKDQKIKFSHTGNNIEVVTDPLMLRNIVINILSNAIKYSPNASEIEFYTHLNGQYLEIEVVDHGIGIPSNEQVHLFENFFRAKNAINTKGIGLGLNIVKRYTDILNGKITFDSKEGEGSKFKVYIPSKSVVNNN
jgi:signal transduction histidine kinase